jgi:ankyrin repeat protein
MKRGGPTLWLILAVAAGLSIPPLVLVVDELTGRAVPEVNPLFIGGLALFWLVVVWSLVAICITVPRGFVRIPVLVLLLMPYVAWIQKVAEQGFFWSLIRPDMATGEGYFGTKAERDLAAAIVACDFHDDPPKCDFPRVDALARAANVNTTGLRGKSFMDLALDAGGFPEVVGSLLRAGETAGDARRKAMHYACEQVRPDLTRAVLAAGVDPNLREANGRPYMIMATAMPDGLAAFLDAGADVDTETLDGWTALMQAVRSMQFRSVALLLAHGAREDQVAKDGTTLDKLMADVAPEMLNNLPPDVDAFVKRHQPR